MDSDNINNKDDRERLSNKSSSARFIYGLIDRYSIFGDKLEPGLIRKFNGNRDFLIKQLVLRNVHLILWLAKHYKVMSQYFDDFASVCFIGLVKAAMTFDPNRKAMFRSYAIKCMITEVARDTLYTFRHFDRLKLMYIDSDWLKRRNMNEDADDGDEGPLAKWVYKHLDKSVVKLDDLTESLNSFDSKAVLDLILRYVLAHDRLTDNQKLIFKLLTENELNAAVVARITGKSHQWISLVYKQVLGVIHEKFSFNGGDLTIIDPRPERKREKPGTRRIIWRKG